MGDVLLEGRWRAAGGLWAGLVGRLAGGHGSQPLAAGGGAVQIADIARNTDVVFEREGAAPREAAPGTFEVPVAETAL